MIIFAGVLNLIPNDSLVSNDFTVVFFQNLCRGSLYRLIHRPNNQLDERRRLRMALDAVLLFFSSILTPFEFCHLRL